MVDRQFVARNPFPERFRIDSHISWEDYVLTVRVFSAPRCMCAGGSSEADAPTYSTFGRLYR
jgi:hypothetical protein